jgi:osmoprotectant transport system permease protein
MIKTPSKKKMLRWVWVILFTALYVILIFDTEIWQSILSLLFPDESEVIYPRASLRVLVKEHLVLVMVSSFLAISIGVPMGIFVTRRSGKEYLKPVDDISSLAQTFPPVAVLALAVPILGFGFKPTVIALFLYSILPILRNTTAGLQAVAPEIVEAGKGMGMTPRQILMKVELPLALRVIMAGIRISVVINIGTATIGAVVGAGGLGQPIISGLVRENPAFIIQGAVTAALLSLLADQMLGLLEASFAARNLRE